MGIRSKCLFANHSIAVDPMAIKDIKVVETIKEGQTIYSPA